MSKIVLEFSRQEIDKILDAIEGMAIQMELETRHADASEWRQFAVELEVASRQ